MGHSLSAEMSKVMIDREVVDHKGNPKDLSEITTDDLKEIYDEIVSLYDDPGWNILKMEPIADEWQALCLSCSKRSSDLVLALQFLQVGIEVIGCPEWEDGYLSIGISEIRERISSASNILTSEQIKVFRKFATEDQDDWWTPISAAVMMLTWKLPVQEFDSLVIAYEAMRTSSFFADDPWSDDSDQNDQCNWMPLLVLAVLSSSGSPEILRVVDRTCRTSSATPFWMLVCGITMYRAETAIQEKYEYKGWFPEPFWKDEVFHHVHKGLKINIEALAVLINLYIQNSEDWIWTNHYHVTSDNINEYLVDFTKGGRGVS
jgi:hypothetical protein